jgi:uncharacterized protein
MRNDAYPDAFLRDILAAVKTIAVVGSSNRKTRPSFGVFAYLLARGYQVIGVNPGLAGKSVDGTAFFKTLADVPGGHRHGGHFPQLGSGRGSRQ